MSSPARRHRRDEALAELDERLVQVARVGVQPARLADDRFGDARVAVPDDRNVVVGVEQPRPVRLEQPDALPRTTWTGSVVRERRQRRAEDATASGGELPRRHRRPRRAEPARDLVGSELVEGLQQRPGVGVPELDVLRVLRVALRAPRADGDDRRQPRGDEIAQHLELLGLERDARRIAVDCDPRDAEDVVLPAARAAARRARRRSRPTCADGAMSPKSTIPETRPWSSSRTLSRLKSPWTTCARRRGQRGATRSSKRSSTRSSSRRRLSSGISLEQRPQAGRVSQVPEQLTARRGMEEAAEREVEPGVRRRVGAHRIVGKLRAPVSSLQPLEEPDEVALAPRRRASAARPAARGRPARRAAPPPARGRARRGPRRCSRS